MGQRVDEVELSYQYLLILAYFTAHYKNYKFSEIARMMGMTHAEVKNSIDCLLEIKMLVIIDQFVVISKIGEDILKNYKLENIFIEQEKNLGAKQKWNIDDPYVPLDFSM